MQNVQIQFGHFGPLIIMFMSSAQVNFDGIHYRLSLIGEDNLLDVLEEMIPVVNNWKAIGRGLRIDSGYLEMIQKDNPGNSKECLSELLTCWLKRNYNVARFGEPTWQAVVEVLARPAAGDNCALALSIARQHPGNSKECFCIIIL